MSSSSGSNRLKIQPARTAVNVLKRDGSVQPFDQNKLVSSITKAGATQPQATLVANRVVNRINTPTIATTQLSSMVTNSLDQVNPIASSQYIAYRDQKLQVARPNMQTTATAALINLGPLPDLMITSFRFINVQSSDRDDYNNVEEIYIDYEFMNNGDEVAYFDYQSSLIEIRLLNDRGQIVGSPRHVTIDNSQQYRAPDGSPKQYWITPGRKGSGFYYFGRITEPGTYTFECEINYKHDILESNMSNNVYKTPPFAVRLKAVPDLIITGMELEAPTDWQGHTFNIHVKNIGQGEGFGLSHYFGINNEEVLGVAKEGQGVSQTQPKILPGVTLVYTGKRKLFVTPGTYEWIVEVNSRKSEVESNYENNKATFTVVLGENLEVVSVTQKPTPLTAQLAVGSMSAPPISSLHTYQQNYKAKPSMVPVETKSPPLNVVKRDGSTQQYAPAKLASSIEKAGATPAQAALVTNRVTSSLANQSSITSAQLSSMTARSLSRVNTAASQNYTAYRDQKLVLRRKT